MSTASETTSRTGRRQLGRTMLVVSNPSPTSDSDSDERGDLRLESRVPSVVSASSPSGTSSPPPITPSHAPHPVVEDNAQIKMQISAPPPPPPPPPATVRSVRSPDNKTIILVTSDSDHFATVQITGFQNAAFVKELIFAKLQIPDEDYARYSIYRTDIDAYATSGALSDDELYKLCVEEGDSKGSLRLLVATSSAAVHNPAVSPGLSGVPPPMQASSPYASSPYSMVQHTTQQRAPRHRSTSRHGSVSSRSERLSQIDDFDDDGRRGTLRPPARPLSPPVAPRMAHVRTGSDVGQQAQGESEREKVRRVREERERRNLAWSSVDSPTTPNAQHRIKPPPPPHYPARIPPTPSTPPAASASSSSRRLQNEQRKKVPQGWVNFTGAKPAQPSSSPNRNAMNRMRSVDSLRDANRHPGSLTPGSGHPPQPQSRPTVPPLPSLPSMPHTPPGALQSGHRFPSSSSTATTPRPVRPLPQSGQSQNQSQSHIQSPDSGYGSFIGPRPPPPLPPLPMSPPSNGLGPPLMHEPYARPRSTVDDTPYPPPPPMPPHYASWSQPQNPFPAPFKEPSAGSTPTYQVRQLPPTHADPPPTSTARALPTFPPNNRPSYEQHKPSPPRSPASPRSPQTSQDRGYASLLEPPPLPPPLTPALSVSPTTNGEGTATELTGVIDGSATAQFGSLQRLLDSLGNGVSASGTDSENATMVPPTFRAQPAPPMQATNSQKEFNHIPPPPPLRAPPRLPQPPTLHPDSGYGTGTTMGTNALQALATLTNGGTNMSALSGTSESVGTLDSDSEGLWNVAPAPRPAPGIPDLGITAEDLENGTVSSISTEGTGYWKAPLRMSRGPPLTVTTEQLQQRPSTQPLNVNGGSNGMGAIAAGGASGLYKHPIPANFPPPPRDPPPSPPREPYGGRTPRRSRRNLGNGTGVSHAGHSPDSSWADRPNPEDVIDRLEQWFPNHDVDKPVIESSSGGTSPTAAIAPPVPAAPIPPHMVAAQKRGHKKSIRVVAEEHKQRISRIGRGVKAGKDGMQGGFASDVARKRSTKLWDSKVEEVTPGQIRAGMPSITPESPAGTATAARKQAIFKWVRGELIGKGNFGRVYLAMNVTTGEMIAVKQVEIPRTASDRSDARQANVVDALKLESETLKDLDHPNIVQYLGFEETPTFLSIFLEYVPGGSVGGILRKYGRFDEDVTKSFTSQILAGLEYLHSKGILHRDMKADNVLVEQTGICKISDFGISKRTEDINEAAVMTAMQGTVFWMAPEVVNTGKRGYNSKVDIWSVGCVVLEMWAGERPWRELEAMAVIVKLYSKGQAPPVPQGLDLSDLAEEFRKLCFAVDPDKRPTAAELRKHPYLVLPPDWTFTGFTHRDNALEEAEKF